jgi:hypothetical protein
MKPFVAAFVIAVVAPIAAAQQQAPRADPTDSAAPVPALNYNSAFAGYRGYREEPLAPWRGVNEEVTRAGGHFGIFGGGQKGHDSSKPAAKPAAPKPDSSLEPAPTTPGGGHRH